MKTSFIPLSFKGYDATTLSAIHIQNRLYNAISKELDEVAQQEELEIKCSSDSTKWSQDYKTIIEKRNKPFMITDWQIDADFFDKLKKKYGISGQEKRSFIEGGNCFIGRNIFGENFMLVGENSIGYGDKNQISKTYNVKSKNIFKLPQQNFHLDMFIRPIGHPYVLVNNPELVLKKYEELNQNGEFEELKNNFIEYEKERSSKYCSYDKTIKALKKAGFIPIEIAGDYGSGINFMNAIVNQYNNGDLSYITNGTKTLDKSKMIFQDIFEKDLKQKVAEIKKIYFINGKLEQDSNFMMNQLAHFQGGLHCMTVEEPNFAYWA